MIGRIEELAEIDALFARADADHDGQIDFPEFRALARELDDELSEEELDEESFFAAVVSVLDSSLPPESVAPARLRP